MPSCLLPASLVTRHPQATPTRLFRLIAMLASLAGVVLLTPPRVAAQQGRKKSTTSLGTVTPNSCNPLTGCGAGNPPTIYFVPDPRGNTYTSSQLALTIYWCDDGGLQSGSRSLILNGTSVSTTYATTTYSGCYAAAKSTATLNLIPGRDSITASIKDNYGQQTTIGGHFTYDARKFSVSPKGAIFTVFSEQQDTTSFSVTNHESTTQTYNLTLSCSGSVTGCSADSAQVTAVPGATSYVHLSYQSPTFGNSGTVQMIFASTSIGYDVDTASATVNATAKATAARFNGDVNDNQALGLCANGCFSTRYSHSTVPYVSLGQARAVTLQYDESRTAVRPVISADVTLAAGAPNPEQLELQATLNGALVHFLNGDSILHFQSDAAHLTAGATTPVRLAGQFDASSYPSGMYPLAITVTAIYPDHNELTTDTTKLMVVNLRTPDLLPVAGWTVAGVQHLLFQTDGTVLIVEGDGSGTYFKCTTYSVPCAGPSGDFSTLKASGSGDSLTYTRAYPDSSKAIFNNLGEMTRAVDRWGNATDYTYTAVGKLNSIEDPFMTYNGGASRSATVFSYTSGGFSIEPPGPNGGAPSGTRNSVVSYDASNRVTRIKDPDGLGDSLTYDASGRLASVIDRRGDSTTYHYDSTSWLLSTITLPQIQVDAGAPGSTVSASPVIRYRPWQTVGVPTASTTTNYAPPVRIDTLVALVTDPDSATSRYTVDRWGQPLVEVDPLSDTTVIARSGIFATTVTNALGQVDSARYSGPFLTYSHPHDQPSTAYMYDTWGMVRSITGGGGPSQALGFKADSGLIADTLAGIYITKYYLDTRGRDTLMIDPAGHTSRYVYEATFGNLDSTIAAAGQWSRTMYNGYGLDSVDAANSTASSRRVYDNLDRLTQAYDSVGAKPTTYTYDPLFLTTVRDPKGQVYRTDVNALGWSTTIYDPADTVTWGLYTRQQYDRDGRTVRWRNRREQWSSLQYDAVGRLTSRRDTITPADSFQYLDHGRVEIASNAISTDTIALGSAGSDTTTTVLAGSRWFRRTWSKVAGATSDTLSIASSVTGLSFIPRTRFWDPTTGTLDSLKVGTSAVRYAYNDELLRDSIAYPSYSTLQLTTSTHQLFEQIYSSSTILDSIFGRRYAYDSLSRIANESRIDGYLNGWVYKVRSYGYNGDGALRWYQQAQSNNRSCDPSYGCIASGDSATQTYGYPTYDGALNLLVQIDSTHGDLKDSATFAAGDRITSWLGSTYTYDADGNRDTTIDNGTITSYSWSPDNRLMEVRSGSETIDYDYNALGQLVRRRTNGTVDRYFLWQDGQLLTELDGTATNRLNEFAYSPGVDQPLARITGNGSTAIEFEQMDERGNVLGLTSGSTATQRLEYGPWGAIEMQLGDSLGQTRLGWKGLMWEGGITGLYYVRARWYDPVTRNFVSGDPIGLAGGLNPYAFALNDPINGADPTGLWLLAPVVTQGVASPIPCLNEPDITCWYSTGDGGLICVHVACGGGLSVWEPATGPAYGEGGGEGLFGAVKRFVSRIHVTPTRECGIDAGLAALSIAADAIGGKELVGGVVGLAKAGAYSLEAGLLSLSLDEAKQLGISSVSRAYAAAQVSEAVNAIPAVATLGTHAQEVLQKSQFTGHIEWADFIPFVGSALATVNAVKACFSFK